MYTIDRDKDCILKYGWSHAYLMEYYQDSILVFMEGWIFLQMNLPPQHICSGPSSPTLLSFISPLKYQVNIPWFPELSYSLFQPIRIIIVTKKLSRRPYLGVDGFTINGCIRYNNLIWGGCRFVEDNTSIYNLSPVFILFLTLQVLLKIKSSIVSAILFWFHWNFTFILCYFLFFWLINFHVVDVLILCSCDGHVLKNSHCWCLLFLLTSWLWFHPPLIPPPSLFICTKLCYTFPTYFYLQK